MGLLARLVPGGAAEHDPRLLLRRRSVPSLDGQLHSDPHANRLVDARNLDRRHLAPLHPRLPGNPLRDALRHGASPSLDDPDDLPRDRMDLPPGDGARGSVLPFHQIDGSGLFSSAFGHGWLTIYIAFAFLLTWNVIAMEAAACYIGECKNPARDAKIALNLEGGYGVFIYTMIPISFVIVFGASKLGNPLLADPRTIFSDFAGKIFGG